MLFVSNVCGQVPIGGHTWNLPLQMQLYAVLPFAVWAMQPRSAAFRSRLAWSCLAAIMVSSLYQTWVVISWDLMWPIPEQAAFNQGASAGHDPESVRMSRTYFGLLYMAFMARMTDFAAGVLVYIALTSEAVQDASRRHSRLCSGVSCIFLAISGYMCFGGHVALRPTADFEATLSLRISMLVLGKGLWCPLSTAWLLLHLMLQPDNATRRVAKFMSSSRWNALAKRTYSVFLVHPLVLVWLFQAADMPQLIGPLHSLPSYATLCLATLAASLVVGSILDMVVAACEHFAMWLATVKHYPGKNRKVK